jgi:hypothetical protein
MPGVYLAESLTKAVNGKCIISIVNTLAEDITLDRPQVILEAVDDSEEAMTLIHTSVEVAGWLSKLHEHPRTDHLNYDKRGSSNTKADTLSRIHVTETTPTEQGKPKIFQEMHMKPLGGHLGMNKT